MVGMKALPYLVVVRPLVGDKIHTKKIYVREEAINEFNNESYSNKNIQ